MKKLDITELNGNRFIPIDKEELSALELISKMTIKTNMVIDELDNKVDQGGDFTGSWHGLEKPTLSEEGAHAQVDKNTNDIKALKKLVDKTVVIDSNENFSQALQNANDSMLLTGGIIVIKAGEYDLTDTFKWNQRKVNIVGEYGCVINTRMLKNEYAIEYASIHPIGNSNNIYMKNITFINDTIDRKFILLSSEYDANGAFITYENVCVVGFSEQLVMGNNIPFTTFNDCRFIGVLSHYQEGTIIKIKSTTNSGECVRFNNCQFGNTGTIIDGTTSNLNGSIFFSKCGFDYFKRLVVSNYPIRINIDQSHIETHTYSNYLIDINNQGTGAYVRINNSEIWLVNTVTNHIVNCVGNFTKVEFLNCFLQAPNGYTVKTMATPQSENVMFRNTGTHAGQQHIPVGKCDNLLPYYVDDPKLINYIRSEQSDGINGDTMSISPTQFEGHNTLVIDDNNAGNQIRKYIYIPLDYEKSILYWKFNLNAENFVNSAYEVRFFTCDQYLNTVQDCGVYDGRNTNGFREFINGTQWHSPRAKYFCIFIYCSPNNDGHRKMTLGDIVVNQL